jgi:hypothetical protein
MELADETEAAQEGARRGREISTSDALKGIPTRGGLIIVDDEWDNSVVDIPLEVTLISLRTPSRRQKGS